MPTQTVQRRIDHIDIDHTRTHLRQAGIHFNDEDLKVVNGDMTTLEGTLEQYGRHTIRFKIMCRWNGIFVDYHEGMGCRHYLKQVIGW